MNKSGQVDTETSQSDVPPIEQNVTSNSRRGCSLWLLLVLLVGVVIALILGLQLFGIISVLVFPPDAPLPEGITELSHERIGHGSDSKIYTSDLSPCELITFYEQNNSTCTSAGRLCAQGEYKSPGFPLEVASCIGVDDVSIFGMRWEVNIFTELEEDQEVTRFRLTRDILWNGSAPQATTLP